MKIKLLKKIRKRYSIIQVNKVDYFDEMYTYNKMAVKDGLLLPFYRVCETGDEHKMFYYDCVVQTYKEALQVIINTVKSEYKRTKKRKVETQVKVWYNKNINK